YYNLFKGETEIKMMNLMGYDAMTIGNHEFDFGLENMARLFRMANFPVVCSNYDVTGTILEGLVKPYITLEREGVRIGVFGLAPRMEGLVQEDKCEGIVYNDPITVAQQMADLLREKEHCDVVICLSHLGIRSSRPENVSDEVLIGKTYGIDAILGGHSHTFMEKPTIYLNAEGKNVSLLHSGKNGIYVGEMVLTVTEK
ncbi:MAG: metallophosphatase, partial [Bacteroides sp.]|nr:metallophosphatase [Bacteroides sp.]